MFQVDYTIIHEDFSETATMSEEELRYYFLQGSITFAFSDIRIEMNWDWIPLLDFAYSMKTIVAVLKSNDYSTALFDFTENVETLQFVRYKESVKIVPSFLPTIIMQVPLPQFEQGVYDFHFKISKYIQAKLFDKLPDRLKKYLLST